MPLKPLTCLLLGLALMRCGPADSVPEAEPEYWVVTHNSRGFRDQFIDPGKILELRDSTIRVHYPESPGNFRDYDLLDGYVNGLGDGYWALERDSIGFRLVDTVSGNMNFVRRMKSSEVTADSLLEFLTQSPLIYHTGFGMTRQVFLGKSTNVSSCYFERTVADFSYELPDGLIITKQSVSSPAKTSWLLNDTFNRPLILINAGLAREQLIFVDSLRGDSLYAHTRFGSSTSSDLYGSFKAGRQPRLPNYSGAAFYDFITRVLPAGQTKNVSSEYRSRIPVDTETGGWIYDHNGDDWRQGLALYLDEVDRLQLKLSDRDFQLRGANDKVLGKGTYTLFNQQPFLILDGDCEADDFWPIEAFSEDSLVISVPVRIGREMPVPENLPVEGVTSNPVKYQVNDLLFTFRKAR